MPRPFLGLAMQPIPIPEPARKLFPDGADETLLVTHVEPKAPAVHAGVMVGDVIVSFNGKPVHGVHEILHRIRALHIGDPISLAVLRGWPITIKTADLPCIEVDGPIWDNATFAERWRCPAVIAAMYDVAISSIYPPGDKTYETSASGGVWAFSAFGLWLWRGRLDC